IGPFVPARPGPPDLPAHRAPPHRGRGRPAPPAHQHRPLALALRPGVRPRLLRPPLDSRRRCRARHGLGGGDNTGTGIGPLCPFPGGVDLLASCPFPTDTTLMTAKVPVILLVEDSPADVHIMQRAVRETSLSVDLMVVHDGEEAVDYLLRQGKYA